MPSLHAGYEDSSDEDRFFSRRRMQASGEQLGRQALLDLLGVASERDRPEIW
jgi:hypothetical protein